MKKDNNECCFSIRGDVEIIDNNTGKTLVHDHNMVVKGGRQYILDLFLKKNISYIYMPETTADYAEYHLKKIQFGGYSATNPVSTPAQPKLSDEKLANALDDYSYDITGNNTAYASDKKRIAFTVTQAGLKNSGTAAVIFNELGIFIGINDNNEDTLFSRITFDDIYFTAESSITLNYYIYFGLEEGNN